jgi:hypothetical protein
MHYTTAAPTASNFTANFRFWSNSIKSRLLLNKLTGTRSLENGFSFFWHFVSNRNYYVSQTLNSCESTRTLVCGNSIQLLHQQQLRLSLCCTCDHCKYCNCRFYHCFARNLSVKLPQTLTNNDTFSRHMSYYNPNNKYCPSTSMQF